MGGFYKQHGACYLVLIGVFRWPVWSCHADLKNTKLGLQVQDP